MLLTMTRVPGKSGPGHLRFRDHGRQYRLYRSHGKAAVKVIGMRAEALERLEVFVGEWVLEARFPGAEPVLARTWFEWALDRQFLVQRTENPVAEAPDGLMIVSTDPQTGAYTQHYYDSRGVVRLYAMTLAAGTWTLTRESADFTPLDFGQRYTGTFSADLNAITGGWEMRLPDADWAPDFVLNYRRATSADS